MKQPLHVKFLRSKIIESPDIKLLGLYIDNELNFEKYISGLISKCEGTVRFLWRTAKDRSFHHRKLLASCLVMSKLQYCDTVFHQYISTTLSAKLESVQYRLMRFVSGTARNERTSASCLRRLVNWKTLDEVRNFKLHRLMWRMLYTDELPSYLRSCLSLHQAYNTRFRSQILPSQHRTGRFTLNSFYSLSFIKLPGSVLRSETTEQFKKRFFSL